MNLSPGIIIGDKYRLMRRLAVGGQGSVWVAVHIQLQAEVAVKFLDLSQSNAETARMRFEREARAAAKIKSPNIVPVIDVGEHEHTPYLVMELCQGENLDKRLKTANRLDPHTTAHILNQIARGLRRMHEAGFVHRDLKPSNIFLAKNDDSEEVVKILDFGIVKETNPIIGDGTKTGEFMGSVFYVSPEQIKDAKTADFRSDLWSLGVIVYRAITGKLPFPGPAIGSALAQILNGPIEPPTQIVPELPSALDIFFKKALNRDKNGRFQSALEMAEAFALACKARRPQVSIAVPEGSEWPALEVKEELDAPPPPVIDQQPNNPPRPIPNATASIIHPNAFQPTPNPPVAAPSLKGTQPLPRPQLGHPHMGTQKLPPGFPVFADPRPPQSQAHPEQPSAPPASTAYHPTASYPEPANSIENHANSNIGPGMPVMTDETITNIARKNPFRSNTRWVVGGLILGTLFGGLIALVVILLRV